MWHGLDLVTWIRLLRKRPPMAWSHGLRVASITATACSNSALAGLESLFYRQTVARTEIPAPLFIIGHWRSGTTLLHNLLALDRQFAAPNLFQTVFPSHFLVSEPILAPLTKWLLPSKRTMDDIPVTGWDIPQEDEIGICLLSLLSPYLMLAFPENRDVYAPYLDLQSVPDRVIEKWKEVFVNYLQKLMVRNPGRRLLLKSPSHTYRIRLLLELFPDARFVHIVRNPYQVISSSIHLRQVTFVDNALHPPDFSHIEDDVLALYETCFERLDEDLSQIPPGRCHEVRMEDLEADIPGELRRIFEKLELAPSAELEGTLASRLPALKKHRKNVFEISPRLRRRIDDCCRPIFDRYGYPTAEPQPEVA
jgi:hypothetical protein